MGELREALDPASLRPGRVTAGAAGARAGEIREEPAAVQVEPQGASSPPCRAVGLREAKASVSRRQAGGRAGFRQLEHLGPAEAGLAAGALVLGLK